jgi:hypothetical protein
MKFHDGKRGTIRKNTRGNFFELRSSPGEPKRSLGLVGVGLVLIPLIAVIIMIAIDIHR